MKVIYLIGNGFDLNLGLKTSYCDFYNYYLNVKNEDTQISQLKVHLQQDKDTQGRYKFWSDLEIAMGEYTKNFSNQEDMEKVYNDLNDRLREYIQKIEKDGIKGGINRNKLISDLAHPEKYLREKFKEEFFAFCKKWETQSYETFIISFNYTNTIEMILNMKETMDIGKTKYGRSNTLYPIIHIHGKTDAPLIGLNDKTQIKNEILRENEDVQDFLLKPRINDAIGHLKDRESLNHINTASLIYLFGVSLGETDKLWWEAIGERLKHDCRIIYFVYNKEENPRPAEFNRVRKKYKNILLAKTKLTKEEKDLAYDKIYIVLNSEMFKLKQGNDTNN